MNGMREFRSRERRAAGGHPAEIAVFRDLPGDRQGPARHAALRRQRIGREARPDDEAVGGWLAARDAKGEWVGSESLLRPRGRGDGAKRRHAHRPAQKAAAGQVEDMACRAVHGDSGGTRPNMPHRRGGGV
jgi:hypothetical protein